MTTFLLTAGVMGMVVGIMSIGVVMGREPLKGSCGGIAGKDCLCLKEGKLVGSCDPGDADSI